MDITVKKVSINELSLLMEWRIRVIKEVFSISENTDTTELYDMNESYYRTHLGDGSHTACFAYCGKEIIGCGGICYQQEMPSPDNRTGKCGYLMNIYVLPDYRRKAVGKQIVAFLTEDAKNKCVEKLSLESSEIAEKLYQSMGFKRNNHFYLKYL